MYWLPQISIYIATVISPGDHFTLTIECFTDSLVGSLHVNEAIDPLHYQFSTAFYCTLFNVSNVRIHGIHGHFIMAQQCSH